MRSTLITGSTGFIGRHLVQSFKKKGDQIVTLGRSASNDVRCDLSLSIPEFNNYFSTVIHCAGLAHRYPRNPAEEKDFFDNHILAAQNLLTSLNHENCQKFIFISSVAVYGIDEGVNLSEMTEPLPKTIYGKCKLKAEELIQNWGKKNDVPVYIFRLPLVVGDNPPGNLGAMIKAMIKRYYFNIANINPKKSMVLAQDVADFLAESEKFASPGIYNLTDGYHPSMREIEQCIMRKKNIGLKPVTLPFFLIRIFGWIGNWFPSAPINSFKVKKLSTDLTYSDEKARANLQWKPSLVIDGW